MTDVLITAGELTEFLKKEPCVVIDTRNPDAYGAGHLPNAVNVHEIFTYLATSTPLGHGLRRISRAPKHTAARPSTISGAVSSASASAARTASHRTAPPRHSGTTTRTAES